MAQEGLLEELRAAVSCPVCLDILTDPVTLDCGHHCCASCLQECWQDLPDIYPCPVCQHHCDHRRLQKNIQLSSLTDLLKKLPSTGSKKQQQQELPLCEQHQQVLSLFCEKDLQLVCAKCRVSCEQQGHPLTPSQEAADEHRKKLKSYLQSLKKQLEVAKKRLEMQVKKTQEFKKQLKHQKNQVQRDALSLKHFLSENQAALEVNLFNEVTIASKNLTDHKKQLSAFSFKIQTLLSEATETYSQSDLDFLMSMRSLQHQMDSRYTLRVPKVYRYLFKKMIPSLPPHYFGLYNFSMFYKDLTLDPETAHHSFIISEDQKRAVFSYERIGLGCTPRSKAFISHAAVLGGGGGGGDLGFEAGRHFWTVKISGTGTFSVGVCKESFPRDSLGPRTSDKGCWKITQVIGSPHLSDVLAVDIGVFLDYELKEISFFNMRQRSIIVTEQPTFTGKLRPYFSVEASTSSLTMSLVKDKF